MKTAILAVAAALALAPVRASALDPWTATDTKVEIAYAALHLADWSQTARLSKWGGEWYETSPGGMWLRRPTEANPILGATPSLARVNVYFASALVTHALVAAILPGPWRRAWQTATIGIEVGFVAHNAQGGVALTVPW